MYSVLRPLVLCLAAIAALTPMALADVPLIDNPREAPVRHTIHYEEVWRAGADDEADFIFGVISAAVTDAEGNVYLLDTQQFIVFKFSPAGKYLGTVSRRGEGPGEIENSFDLIRWDANHLAMSRLIPSGLVIVDNDGTPAPGVTFDCDKRHEAQRFTFVNDLQARDGHLVGSGMVHRFEADLIQEINFVVSLDRDGREIHGFGNFEKVGRNDHGFHIDEKASFNPATTWALGKGGEIYFVPNWDEWRIEVRRTTGEHLRTIHRDFDPHHRSKEEIEAVKGQWTFSGPVQEVDFDISDTDPAIRKLEFVDGELRVRSWELDRNRPDGIAERFDVLDPAGHLIEERSLAFPFDEGEDKILNLDDGRVARIKAFKSAEAASQEAYKVENGERVALTSDEEVVLEVIIYRPIEE